MVVSVTTIMTINSSLFPVSESHSYSMLLLHIWKFSIWYIFVLFSQLQLFVAYAVHEVIEPHLASVVAEAHQTASIVSRVSHQSSHIELMSSLVANGDHFYYHTYLEVAVIYPWVIEVFRNYQKLYPPTAHNQNPHLQALLFCLFCA